MTEICILDEDNCLTLESILEAFHCGIKEEHSWALIYQSIDSLKQFSYKTNDNIYFNSLLSSSNLYIKNNGTIHEKSWHSSDDNNERMTTRGMIKSIGFVVYKALDYGNSGEEETIITPSLELLIELMTQESSTDEGIEEDNGSEEDILDEILNMCTNHIFDNRNVGEHYRNVCRALAAEAIELSTFLDRISMGTKELQKNMGDNNEDVDNLHVQVWAHLWMKVMRELRSGVNLNSSNRQELSESQKREYELTPFELLLDDINSKRYTLKKVMSLPKKVEKDARNLILEFVRSRPPLKPVKDRVLNPLPQSEPCLHQKLMEGIKQTHSLKPTPPLVRKFNSLYVTKGKRYSNVFPLNHKQLIDNKYKVEIASEAINFRFNRFSLRNLSLRNIRVNKERVLIANPTQIANQRKSFWAKLIQPFC